ncbi:MAG: hypothetical protein E7042_06830 [Lentisphaerae bacterium]|nr:hypothetical protein [Lentisphaerota bacterium]
MAIKKLNSMFHKHSRWLFGIFAAIIIIAFMDFLTPGRGGCAFSGEPEDQQVGTAFGEKVTYGDLMDIDRDLQVFESLTGARSQHELRMLFFNYCMLKRAEQLGFTFSDKQVAEMLRVLPVFMDNGKFSRAKYDEFLKNNQLSSADLIKSVRNALVIQQIPGFFRRDITVTDQEIETVYKSNFPRVAIRAFQVKDSLFSDKVKIDDAALKKYMAANKADYVIPGKLDTLVIELSSEPYKAAAEKSVTDQFVADLIKNRGLEGVDVKTIRPLLVNQKATELAAARMNAFYRTANAAIEEAKDFNAKVEAFRNAAANSKLTVVEAKNVEFNSQMIDKVEAPELIAELRSMPISDTISPLTRPRRSGKGVAVAMLIKRTAPRQMSFEEAKAKLTADYRKAESVKLARIHAKNLWSGVIKLAPAKRSAAFAKLGKMENIVFSMISAPEKNELHMSIVRDASPFLGTMKTGDFSPVINTADGAMLVEMVKRYPAVMEKLAENREMIKQGIMEQKAQQLQMEFMVHLDRNCRYEIEDRTQGN